MICHNGSAVCVASSSVQSHLDHGDRLGGCSTNANSNTSAIAAAADLESTVSVTASISVYPNPSSGNFRVSVRSQENGKVSISVYNAVGVLVKSTTDIKNGAFEKEINLQGLPAVVYHVKVNLGNFTDSRSVIIKSSE